MDFDFTSYHYDPLPTPTSIRLLQLIGGRRDPTVLPSLSGRRLLRVTLRTVDLATHPHYRTLSYTWDSPQPEWAKRSADLSATNGYGAISKWPIAVNGRLLYVQKNLFEALERLQIRSGGGTTEDEDWNTEWTDPDNFDKTQLVSYAESGDMGGVMSQLERGASVGASDSFGETALHYAAENGHYEIVRELVRAGADWTVFDSRGRTPLHCAVHRKRGPWKKVVRFLQDGGFRRKELVAGDRFAELEKRYGYDKTALHVAAEWGKVAEVRELVRRGACVGARDAFGETPLHYAAENGEYKTVKLLVRAGSDLAAVDNHGRVPLECAVQAERKWWEKTAEFLRDADVRERVMASEDWEDNENSDVSEEMYWIDAICINQADLEERSAQVRIMPQIYGQAQSVLIWLGNTKLSEDRSDDKYDDFKALTAAITRMNSQEEDLQELKRKWQSSLRSFTRKEDEMPEDGIFSREEITQITYWLTRSWFGRTWVVQELALAKNIEMFAADFEFSWSEILKFLCLLFHVGYFDTGTFWRLDEGTRTEDGIGGDGSEAWKLAVVRLRTANNPDEWALLEPIFKQSLPTTLRVRQDEALSLPLLLAECWNFGAKDPRDKVFSLLSLAAPLPLWDQIKIDYISPVSDLYTDVAHLFLRGSGTSSIYVTDAGPAGILEPLEGLSYVQDPYCGREGRNPDLPCWVPDFSTPLITSRIWNRRFEAATGLEPCFGPGNTKSVLRISGLEIDEVVDTERDWDELDFLETDIHALLYFGCSMYAAYEKPDGGDDFFMAYLRTLTVDELWEPNNSDAQAEAVHSLRDFLCAELSLHETCLWGGDDACNGAYEYDPDNERLQDPDPLEKFVASLDDDNEPEDLLVALKALRTKDSGDYLPTDEQITSFEMPEGWCEYHGPDCSSETENRKNFRSVMNKYYRKRGLFKTKAGRFGLGPQSLVEGDKLLLVAGARTPFAVGDMSEDDEEDGGIPLFRFIGEVYLYGAMYGEAAKDRAADFGTVDLV